MCPIYGLIRKVHMYTGLVNFAILLVYGIAGLTATLEDSPERRPSLEPAVAYREFNMPAGLDDQQAADRVYEFLQLPLTAPSPKFAIRRDAANDLVLDFYSMNGPSRAVVLEKENRIRLERRRNSVWQFVNNLHSTTINARTPDRRVRWWAYYNEAALWSLSGMAISGAYLWLASRPRYRPAQWTFGAGCGLFVLLYVLTR